MGEEEKTSGDKAKSQLSFDDVLSFIEFIEECYGEQFIITEDKNNDKNEKKESSSTKNKGAGIFEKIMEEVSKLPDPYHIIREEKQRMLKDIAERIKVCKKCELWKGRTNAVPGDGNPSAQIVFVGEAPGYEEDKRGKPFVGKSGKLLIKMIQDVLGMRREDVFITNIVRCRPPENRTPEKEEISACLNYLFEELSVIRPRIVVALGAPAAKAILGKDEKISEMRGKFYTRPEFTVFVTFHPAFVVRNPSYTETLENDFKKIKEFFES
jgi:uracil-DNA glycosylase family 4